MKIKTILLSLFWMLLPFLMLSQTPIYPNSVQAFDVFGTGITTHGDWLLASAFPYEDLNKVYAFKKVDNNWVQKDVLMPDEINIGDSFGGDMDIFGDYAVVAAEKADDQGKIYIFHRNGDQWLLDTTMVSSDIEEGDQFGRSVSIYETTILVGSINISSGEQAAYVFTLDNGIWSEQAKLEAATAPFSGFSGTLSLYDDYAVIAANQAKKVYIFKRDGTSWSQQAVILSPDGGSDAFGGAVDIFKDRILIGASSDDEAASNAGAVYIFLRDGTDWNLEKKLVASDGSDGRRFGGRAAMSEFYVVIGMLYDVDFLTGAAYVYERNGTDWSEKEKYTTNGIDYFGWSVAIDDHDAFVGAHSSNISAQAGGAVYWLYLPIITSLEELEKPKAKIQVFPNPGQDYLVLKSEFPAQQVSVINASGKTVQTQSANFDTIFIKNLTPGVYYLQVVFPESMETHMFVKQ